MDKATENDIFLLITHQYCLFTEMQHSCPTGTLAGVATGCVLGTTAIYTALLLAIVCFLRYKK